MHGRCRLRPWEIDQMTMPEIALALDESDDTQTGGAPTLELRHAERRDFVKWYHSLSAAEKVDWFLERRGKS